MSMNILKAALFTPLAKRKNGDIPWGLTMMLWGLPGVGKSHRVLGLAHEWGLVPKVLSPGTDGEGAYGVTPVPDGESMTYPPPYWVRSVAAGGVVFLDEVNQASPPLQAAQMGLALDSKIGDFILDPRVRRIAAGNPTDIAAGGWDLAPPLANRFGHLDWKESSGEEWADWLMGVEVAEVEVKDALTEEARVLAAWGPAWLKASSIVSEFIKANPNLLMKFPEEGSEDASRAYPSPRSWEMAARSIASSDVHGLSEAEAMTFAAAFIGEPAAGELYAYIVAVDLPNPADVLSGAVKFKHSPTRLDRTFVVLTSCAALVSGMASTDLRRDPYTKKLWKILSGKKLMNDALDSGKVCCDRLLKAGMGGFKEAKPVLAKMLPLLAEIGYSHVGKTEYKSKVK